MSSVLDATLGFTVNTVFSLGSLAQDQPANPLALGDQTIYGKSLAALTMLFVIAVLLENALAILFNWRVFQAYFNPRGAKTIILVAAAWTIVAAFDIDIVGSLVAAYRSTTPTPNGFSKFLTALILAGGSAGVYNIMHALGFRDERQEQEPVAKPPKTEAWLAVRIRRPKGASRVGEIQVRMNNLGAATATDPTPIAGTIGSKRPPLGELFFRSSNRFPPSGGYTVEPDHVYQIVVEGKDASGAAAKGLDAKMVFAPGAIVDLEVTV